MPMQRTPPRTRAKATTGQSKPSSAPNANAKPRKHQKPKPTKPSALLAPPSTPVTTVRSAPTTPVPPGYTPGGQLLTATPVAPKPVVNTSHPSQNVSLQSATQANEEAVTEAQDATEGVIVIEDDGDNLEASAESLERTNLSALGAAALGPVTSDAPNKSAEEDLLSHQDAARGASLPVDPKRSALDDLLGLHLEVGENVIDAVLETSNTVNRSNTNESGPKNSTGRGSNQKQQTPNQKRQTSNQKQQTSNRKPGKQSGGKRVKEKPKPDAKGTSEQLKANSSLIHVKGSGPLKSSTPKPNSQNKLAVESAKTFRAFLNSLEACQAAVARGQPLELNKSTIFKSTQSVLAQKIPTGMKAPQILSKGELAPVMPFI